MQLSDQDLILRPYQDKDRLVLPTIADNPNVSRYLSIVFPQPYTQAEADRWVAYAKTQHPTLDFAIEYRGILAGGGGLRPENGDLAGGAELGYWLAEEYWGKGLATRAVRLLVDYGFAHLGLMRVEAKVHTPNQPSARVLEKNGFTREGTLRSAMVRNGIRYDVAIFSRLRSDYTERGMSCRSVTP